MSFFSETNHSKSENFEIELSKFLIFKAETHRTFTDCDSVTTYGKLFPTKNFDLAVVFLKSCRELLNPWQRTLLFSKLDSIFSPELPENLNLDVLWAGHDLHSGQGKDIN